VAVGAADTLFAVWDRRLRAGAQSVGVQDGPGGVTTSGSGQDPCHVTIVGAAPSPGEDAR
jgi:hypothetical protein